MACRRLDGEEAKKKLPVQTPDGKANQMEGGIHLTRRMAETRLEREPPH
jgi:hypothetical protein